MEKKIKVCLITSVHSHDDVRIFHREGKSLLEAGYDVTIICPDYEGVKEDISFIKMPVAQKRFKRIITSWKTALSLAIRVDADIYHIQDPELIKTGLKLKKMGKKVIFDAHEDIGKQILDKDWINRYFRKIIAHYAEKYIINSCGKFDANICATEKIALNYPNSVTVHNYPDEKEMESYHINKKYTLREKNICYIGSLSGQRGVTEMAEAMTNVDGKLLLAGQFDSLYLEDTIRRHKNAEKIQLLGKLNRCDVWDLLSESRIGMMVLKNTVAYQESMPIKLFEYMMAGIPIIASDFTFWRELVGTSAVIFVDNSDIDKIAEAMGYLLANPDIAEKMGMAGKEIALKKYNFKTEKQKLINVYEKMMANNNKGA